MFHSSYENTASRRIRITPFFVVSIATKYEIISEINVVCCVGSEIEIEI